MNKKIIVVIAIILALVAGVIGVLMLLGKDETTTTEQYNPQIVLPSNEDIKEKSPDLDMEIIIDVTTEEIPQEKLDEIADYIEENRIVKVDHYIEDDDPNDDTKTYIGVDGNVHQIVIDPSLSEKTSEELNAEVDAILKYYEGVASGEIDPYEDQKEVITGVEEVTDLTINSDAVENSDNTDYNSGLDGGDHSNDTHTDFSNDPDIEVWDFDETNSEDTSDHEYEVGPGTGAGFTIVG